MISVFALARYLIRSQRESLKTWDLKLVCLPVPISWGKSNCQMKGPPLLGLAAPLWRAQRAPSTSGELADKDYLGSVGVGVALQGHLQFAAAIKATYDTLKALRDGSCA